eukprot:11123751-Prorocentrum_lima.AAC.1
MAVLPEMLPQCLWMDAQTNKRHTHVPSPRKRPTQTKLGSTPCNLEKQHTWSSAPVPTSPSLALA